MNLQEIKDEYARELGYSNFEQVTGERSVFVIESIMDEVAKRYATACILADRQRVAKNAKILVEGVLAKESKTLFTMFDKGIGGLVKRKVSVDKQSILNTPIELL